MRCIFRLLIFFLSCGVSAASYGEERFLLADKVEYNAEEKFAEAIGNVRITFDKYSLQADRVFYDIDRGEVWGYGHVRIFDGGNQVALGEAVLLQRSLKRVVISSFILHFKDSDAVIAAKLANRFNQDHLGLTKTTFTSCPTCKGSKPLWQISAKKADIFPNKYRVVYKNMLFKVYGVPVAYFPYFAHQLPGAAPKSGLLMPNIKNKKLGLPIYFRPKSNLDFTITPRLEKKNLLYEGELRHLLSRGSYRFTGSMIAGKKEVIEMYENKIISKKKIRRYDLAGLGNFSNDSINLGFNINRVSDKGFLREYRHRHNPFLASNIYLYKVDKENFLQVNNLVMQDLRGSAIASSDQRVLPEINFRYIAPLPNLGNSNLKIDNYSSAFVSDEIGNVTRTVWETSLYNTHITDFGQILNVELYNRSDLYNAHIGQALSQKRYTTVRNIPEIRTSLRYPLVSQISNKNLVVEPIALVTLGREEKFGENKKFHFIDSNEYDFDDTNFLRFNRYSGYDYLERGKRITYGVNSLLDTKNNSKIGLFLGQFQKLPYGPKKKSDIVGKTFMNFSDKIELYYRFRKKSSNFKSVFDECGFWYNEGKISLSGGFINLHQVHLKDYKQIRQIYLDTGYNYSQYWRFGFDTRIDVTKSKPHQLMRGIRVTYIGDCVTIYSHVSSDYTSDSSRAIKKSNNYSFAVGLKTLNL